jgi:GNAT superfamily N-acetyltransferase
VPVMENVEIRELHGEEALEAIRPFLVSRKWRVPPVGMLAAKVAFEGDKVVGFAVYQLVPHTEPILVLPSHRGTGLAAELSRQIVEFARKVGGGLMCISTSSIVDDLAIDNGLSPIRGTTVWQDGLGKLEDYASV